MAVRRLSALDAGFLALETDRAPLHVGALLLLDGPAPSDDELRAELLRRVAAVPACGERLRTRWGGLRRPVWDVDPGFQPGAHLRSMTALGPGGRDELRRCVRDLMADRLDTTRPLWAVRRIDGLADGGWALLVEAHHTMVDGVSGTGLLTALLASGPAAPGPAAVDAGRPPRAAPRHRLRRLRQGVRTVAVPDLPASPLNGPLSARRTWDWTTADLEDLRSIAARCRCTVDDVFLAVLAGGLRATLVADGSLPPGSRVRVIVPVSRRPAESVVVPGNLDAALFVELPVHLADVEEMVADVAAQTARAKAQGVPEATEALVHAAALVPPPVLDRMARAYARRGQARVNLAASDVRGPSRPLELCGRQVREIVPCLPLALDVRVTSALLSYAGRATISVTVDDAVGIDASALASAVSTSLAELVAARAA